MGGHQPTLVDLQEQYGGRGVLLKYGGVSTDLAIYT